MHPRRRSRNALVPEVASCGRSEGSDGHTPLPKRGPHLRKRTPSRSGRGGRSPGAAGERALRPNVVASPTGLRSSTQSPHHAKIRQNRTDRASTDARPRLQPPVPTSDSSQSPPASASPRWSTHPVSQHIPIHASRSPCPVAAAPPRPTSTRLGKPAHIYLARRGRGASATRWPPFLESPGVKRKTGRRRGGGPFALKTNP
jgi:hypothetical protein